MKELKNLLLCIVLLGVILYWGPALLRKWGESGKQHIEEQAGVPVQASWQEANGPGKKIVMQYLNKEHPLVVTVVIQRPRTAEEKTMNIEFNPDQYKERQIGWMEGWAFEIGDTVTLSSGDYKPQRLTLR